MSNKYASEILVIMRSIPFTSRIRLLCIWRVLDVYGIRELLNRAGFESTAQDVFEWFNEMLRLKLVKGMVGNDNYGVLIYYFKLTIKGVFFHV